MRGIKMRKKNKNFLYVLALAGIIFLSCFVPYIGQRMIGAYTDKKVIQVESDLEKAKGKEKDENLKQNNEADNIGVQGEYDLKNRVDNQASTQEDNEKDTVDEDTVDEDNKKKEDFDQGIVEYRKTFKPKMTGKQDDIDVFTGNREKEFNQAIADYIYSVYGQTTVDSVEIQGIISDSEQEQSCRIVIHMDKEALPYLCSYNKKLEFYSLYSPKELQ